MNRLKQALYNFFRGRYGVDNYEYFLLIVYAALCLINAIFRNIATQIATWLLFVYILWRMMSRNYIRRSNENRKFMLVFSRIKTEIKLFFDRIRYVRRSRFRKCKHCRAIIKLPNKRGRHTVRCPKCGERFDVKIL